jgi:hypothetical protein
LLRAVVSDAAQRLMCEYGNSVATCCVLLDVA